MYQLCDIASKHVPGYDPKRFRQEIQKAGPDFASRARQFLRTGLQSGLERLAQGGALQVSMEWEIAFGGWPEFDEADRKAAHERLRLVSKMHRLPPPPPLSPSGQAREFYANSSPTRALQRLVELGFVEAGTWALKVERPCVTLNEHRAICPALYAFVEDDVVVYIGKTIFPLQKRMYQYERPGPRQRTSLRNHASIAASIAAGRRVRVLVHKCADSMSYRGITINLAAGLEDALIALFKPAWNRAGK